MKKLLMVESASKAGDDSMCRAKHTMGEEAEAGLGDWRPKWDSEELALLASFMLEGHSLVRELSSGPMVVQLLKLMPTERKAPAVKAVSQSE